jgi:hypothetical protein
VVDQSWLWPAVVDRHVQSIEHELAREVVPHRPANDPSGVGIQLDAPAQGCEKRSDHEGRGDHRYLGLQLLTGQSAEYRFARCHAAEIDEGKYPRYRSQRKDLKTWK